MLVTLPLVTVPVPVPAATTQTVLVCTTPGVPKLVSVPGCETTVTAYAEPLAMGVAKLKDTGLFAVGAIVMLSPPLFWRTRLRVAPELGSGRPVTTPPTVYVLVVHVTVTVAPGTPVPAPFVTTHVW